MTAHSYVCTHTVRGLKKTKKQLTSSFPPFEDDPRALKNDTAGQMGEVWTGDLARIRLLAYRSSPFLAITRLQHSSRPMTHPPAEPDRWRQQPIAEAVAAGLTVLVSGGGGGVRNEA